MIHFDLIWRPAGAADHVIASVDAAKANSDDGGVTKGFIGAVFQADAVPARCDDLLILRIKMTAGSSPFVEIVSNMTIQ